MNRRALPLCRQDEHTCGCCCWGEEVRRPALEAQLGRQTRLFRSRFYPGRPPGRLELVCYEVAARRGLDLLLAVLLWVPVLGDWLRLRLKRHLVCAFLGFEDEGQRRIGCLLHPSRWQGRDVRRQAPRSSLRSDTSARGLRHHGWR